MRRLACSSMLLLACTGGGSSSSSSGSASSSSSSSGNAATTCTEFAVGKTIDASIGGGRASQTQVQAISDYASASAAATTELTTLCKEMASDIAVNQGQIDSALAEPDADDRVKAMCRLATGGIQNARGTGTIELDAPAATCTVPAADSCTAGCVPASTGCTAACEASARGKAECPAPSVTATGTASPDLIASVNRHFGAVLAIHAKLTGMADSAGTLSSGAASITDIKAACIPTVVSAMSASVQEVSAGVEATANLKAAVGAD